MPGLPKPRNLFFLHLCFALSVFLCFALSVFLCFALSVFLCFALSVFLCFALSAGVQAGKQLLSWCQMVLLRAGFLSLL